MCVCQRQTATDVESVGDGACRIGGGSRIEEEEDGTKAGIGGEEEEDVAMNGRHVCCMSLLFKPTGAPRDAPRLTPRHQQQQVQYGTK